MSGAVEPKVENFQLPRPPAAPLAKVGDAVELRGRIAELNVGHDLKPDGTALVNFPCAGGGLLGVRLKVAADAKLDGELAVPAVVVKTSAKVVTVAIVNADGEPQPVDVKA